MKLPALYMSNYILNHKNDYYSKLRMVTEKGNWQDWIRYVLDMVESTSIKGRRQIAQIETAMEKMGAIMQQKLPKIYSRDLIEELFKLPYTKRIFLVKAGLGNIKTVGNYLNELEKAGFLQGEQVGKEKLYLNTELMKILKA